MRPPTLRVAAVLLAALCFGAPALPAQTVTQFRGRARCALVHQNALWIGTPAGLHLYRSADNVWSARTTRSGLPSDSITLLAADQDAVWIGRRDGATRYDPASNTLLSYGGTDGLPPGAVLSFSADPEYIWLGTEHGVARYDRLIEQWQTLGPAQGLRGNAVYAIAQREGRLYFFTESAVNEYDPRYERWRAYTWSDSAMPARDAFLAGGNGWLLRERDLLRFDPASLLFHSYPLDGITGADVEQVAIEGSACWLQARGGIWYYDPQADAFRPFLELTALPERDLHAIAFSTDDAAIWASAGASLYRFDRQTKVWSPLAQAGAPPVETLRDLFSTGTDLIAFTGDRFHTFRPSTNLWYEHDVQTGGAGAGARSWSVDPVAGTEFRFDDRHRFSLTGTRFTWLGQANRSSSSTEVFTSSAYHADLRARLTLGDDRSISATYNDVDYSDVMYGVQYRGARDDVLQTLQWGDVRVEQGARTLLPSFGVFGGGGRITLGPKTDRYHRSLLELSAAGGHRTTAVTTDVYLGRNRSVQGWIRDYEFQRRRFFALPSDAARGEADVQILSTLSPTDPATANELPDPAIAGVAGRWIALAPVKDFVLDDATATVALGTALRNGRALVARYRDAAGALRDALLVSPDTALTELRNRYVLRAGIIPRSLRVTIVDAALTHYPLAQFGLDSDGDARVDPSLVDYDNGILRFPAEQPFPASVYTSSGEAGSVYRMWYEAETMRSSYTLMHAGVVRGSERITVDGAAVRAGDDYVLDYTTGTLLFTRDGVVNDDSRIEVRYEYTSHDVDDRFLQASAVFSPSDAAQVSATGGSWMPAGGASAVTFVHAAGEARLQEGVVDLRVAPEFSRTAASGRGGNAYAVTAAFSAGPARLSYRREQADGGYERKFRQSFAFGELTGEHTLQAECDATQELRLFANWDRRTGRNTISGSGVWGSPVEDDVLRGGLRYRPASLPSITLTAERLTDATSAAGHERYGGRADLEYVASPGALEALGFSSLAMTSYARLARENETHPGLSSASFLTRNVYLRMVAAPRPLFTITGWYRGDARDLDESGGDPQPSTLREKLLLDLVLESIRGVSLGLRHTGDAATFTRPGAGADLDRHPTLQFSSRFSPGLLLEALSPLTLELNARYEASRYEAGGRGGRSILSGLFSSNGGALVAGSESRITEARGEWRPTAALLSLTTLRITRGTSRLSSSFEDLRQTDVIERLDLRNGSTGLYSAQLSVMRVERGWWSSTSYAPMAWAEQRWSALLLTRLTVSTTFVSARQGADRISTADLSPAANVTLSIDGIPLLQRIELREDLAYGRTTRSAEPGSGSQLTKHTVSNILSLDAYPHASTILSLQFSVVQNLASDIAAATRTTSGTLQALIQL
jgi:hypothetical protein